MREWRENKSGQIDYFHLHWPRDPRFFRPGPKILCVRKCEAPTFAYTTKEAYVMMAFNVIKSDRINLLFLTGLLNSRLVRFWLRHRGKMQGNNFQIDKEPLLAIPILAPVDNEQQRIGSMVERIIECRHQLSKARSSAEQEQVSRLMVQWDEEIQTSIKSLYSVSDEEKIALVADQVTTPKVHARQLIYCRVFRRLKLLQPGKNLTVVPRIGDSLDGGCGRAIDRRAGVELDGSNKPKRSPSCIASLGRFSRYRISITPAHRWASGPITSRPFSPAP